MHEMWSSMKAATNRRSFLKNGLATAAGMGLLANDSFGQSGDEEKGEGSGRLTFGDAAMLRFAAAAEIIETEFRLRLHDWRNVIEALGRHVARSAGSSA